MVVSVVFGVCPQAALPGKSFVVTKISSRESGAFEALWRGL
jgi:hypothetical protein